MANVITRKYAMDNATLEISVSANLQDMFTESNRTATVILMRADGSYDTPVDKKVCADNDGMYITWKGTRVYLKNFKFMTTKELVEKMKSHYVSDDDILATMIGDRDDFGAVMKFACKNPSAVARMRDYGCPVNSYNETQLHARFDEREYSSRYWYKTVAFMPKQIKYRSECKSKDFDFGNFCYGVRNGSIRIYSIADEAAQMEEYAKMNEMDEAAPAKESFFASILRFFGRSPIVAE